MSLLTPDECRRLAELLLNAPIAQDRQWRSQLLAGLPSNLCSSIPSSEIASIHLTSIINAVNDGVWSRLPDGTWPVIAVIENARLTLAGSKAGDELQLLLNKLNQRIAPSVGNPFEHKIRVEEIVGREQVIQRIFERLGLEHGNCSVVGPPGSGKTTILNAVFDRIPQQGGWEGYKLCKISARIITRLSDLQQILLHELGGTRLNQLYSLLASKRLRLLALDDADAMRTTRQEGFTIREWLRGHAQQNGIQLFITTSESLSVAFPERPGPTSPWRGIFGPSIILNPLTPDVCRQLIERRLLNTPFKVDQFAELLTSPHQPEELLDLCRQLYEELQGR